MSAMREQANARRLAALARELWLRPNATREQVAAAIDSLSNGARKEWLLARLQGISPTEGPRS